MLNLFLKEQHKITIIAEFKPVINKSEQVIGKLSDYVSNMLKVEDTILTEVQSIPAGYRVTYEINYIRFKWFNRKNYTKELAKLSDWLCNDKDCFGCLSKYHYNHV